MLKEENSMKQKALIVVDVQESFRHRPYYNPADVSEFVHHQQALIDGARRRNIPVVQIFHVEESGPFSLESGNVKTLEPVKIEPDVTFQKHYHSAFAGTPLAS